MSDGTNLIVAGSRGLSDYELLCRTLDELIPAMPQPVTIISGGARGADNLAERYARERGLHIRVFMAEWGRYGRSAGIVRNERMAMVGDVLVAFWDGQSPGTANMIAVARRYGHTTHVVRY